MKWVVVLMVLLMCSEGFAIANIFPSENKIAIIKGSSEEYSIVIESLSDEDELIGFVCC